MSSSRIVANQSQLTRAIALATIRLRLYVREEPHESPFGTTTRLAKALSTGYTQPETGIEVPARPFMKQFFAENKEEITQHIRSSGVVSFDKRKAKIALDECAGWLLSAFRMWVVSGSVSPANATFTVLRKGHNTPIYSSGQLLASVDVEAKIAPAK